MLANRSLHHCNGDQNLLKMNERSYLFTVTCLYSSLRNVTFYLLLYVGGQITLTAGQMSDVKNDS